MSNAAVTFRSGDRVGTRRCASILIYEDSVVENDETFNSFLTENSDRLVIQSGRNVTQVTILEDSDCKSNSRALKILFPVLSNKKNTVNIEILAVHLIWRFGD